MISRAALIGLGTMGPGIAARLARGGIDVYAYDISPSAVESTKDLIELAQGVMDNIGIKPPKEGAGKIEFAPSVEACVFGADLVIENVPENLEIKAETYDEIERHISPEVLLVTDTSGIPISKLQKHVNHGARFLGMHWSNPPHIIPMIEVIAGEQTAPQSVNTIRDFIRSLDLLPVLIKKDVPGFVENRVLYALLRETVDLVEQGVIEPEDIDTCVSWGIGYKLGVLGPMALLDMAGMDIYSSVSSFLNGQLCNRDDTAPIISEKISQGRLGIKSGAGIYDYSPESIATLQKDRARKFVAIRRILEGRDE